MYTRMLVSMMVSAFIEVLPFPWALFPCSLIKEIFASRSASHPLDNKILLLFPGGQAKGRFFRYGDS